MWREKKKEEEKSVNERLTLNSVGVKANTHTHIHYYTNNSLHKRLLVFFLHRERAERCVCIGLSVALSLYMCVCVLRDLAFVLYIFLIQNTYFIPGMGDHGAHYYIFKHKKKKHKH